MLLQTCHHLIHIQCGQCCNQCMPQFLSLGQCFTIHVTIQWMFTNQLTRNNTQCANQATSIPMSKRTPRLWMGCSDTLFQSGCVSGRRETEGWRQRQATAWFHGLVIFRVGFHLQPLLHCKSTTKCHCTCWWRFPQVSHVIRIGRGHVCVCAPCERQPGNYGSNEAPTSRMLWRRPSTDQLLLSSRRHRNALRNDRDVPGMPIC